MSASGAGTDHSDFFIRVRLTLEVLYGVFAVANHTFIENAAFAPDLCGYFLGCSMTKPAVNIGTDCGITMLGKPPGCFPVKLIPTRHMRYENYSRERSFTKWT